MTKRDRRKNDSEKTLQKINGVVKHIKNVQDNCVIIGTKLIQSGQFELGRKLIQNGFKHDVSKLEGMEWEFMSPNQPTTKEEESKLKLKLAIQHHNQTNPHHPEYWGNISDMPELYVAEMVSDWKSRSEEFGTALREWIDETATKKWKFSKDDEIYNRIIKYVDMVCDKPFEQLS